MHGFWRAALYAAALGILAHPVGQALPRRWFDPHRAPYRCRDWEQGGRVYNKLHIRRWKDRLPDMSRLMPDMVKKKLAAADPMSLVQETCVAECVHCWLVVLSSLAATAVGVGAVPAAQDQALGCGLAVWLSALPELDRLHLGLAQPDPALISELARRGLAALDRAKAARPHVPRAAAPAMFQGIG